MPVQQGRHGYFEIAGVKYPCYDVAYTSPRGIVVGSPVGNSWVVNHGFGARTSRVVARMHLREKSTEALSATFFNLFMSRTWSAGFDDTTAFPLKVASGRRLRTISNAKAESFQLVVAFGAVVGLNVVFVAPGPATISDELATDYSNTYDNSPPLMFDRVTFGGVTGGVYGFELTYANNHQPNGPLNGTKFLTSWDAGPMSAAARITVPEHVAAQQPFADGATLTCSLVGAVTRNFSLTNVVPNDPDDIAVNPGQLYLTYNCIVKGSVTTPPLGVS